MALHEVRVFQSAIALSGIEIAADRTALEGNRTLVEANIEIESAKLEAPSRAPTAFSGSRSRSPVRRPLLRPRSPRCKATPRCWPCTLQKSPLSQGFAFPSERHRRRVIADALLTPARDDFTGGPLTSDRAR